jgi:O-antigen ligase
MRTTIFVLWLATLGEDRVDLFGGAGPFMLTPFLVLSPILLGADLAASLRTKGAARLPDGTMAYLLCATVFLCTILLSVLFSSDVVLSGSRGALLCFELYATLMVLVFLSGRPGARRDLVAGAYVGLLVALVFSVVEVVFWVRGSTSPMPGSIVNFTPNSYGPFAPRISGPSGDSNRGGFLFLIYGFLIYEYGHPSRLRTTFLAMAGFLLLATLSRSAMLGATVCGVALLVRGRAVRLRPSGVLVALLVAASIPATLLLAPSVTEGLDRFNAPLAGRFALGDASSSTHVQLIQRGWEVAHESIGNALVGVGFGNASSVLQDLLPGSRYANFHSLYITLLAESGVFALVLGLALLVVPLWRTPRLAPLFLGMMIVNVSYQTTLEPLFWFIVALAWLRWRQAEAAEAPDLQEREAPAAAGTVLRPPDGLPVHG